MNPKRKTLLVITVLSIFFFSFKKPGDPVARLMELLKKYASARPSEKVFVHTDKPYYAAGDTIWYKGYVVDGFNKPTSISNVLYIDLVNDKDSVVSSHKVKLTAGLGNAQIALPINLKAGNYMLYGYTRWMRNFDQDFFLKKSIVIGNPFLEATAQVAATKQVESVVFFPEGGELVTGVRSVVAFKAIDANGLGIGVAGHIEDQQGNKVIEFNDAHLGMGIFALTPEGGKQYVAVLKSGLKVALPVSKSAGYVMSVNNRDTSSLGVRVVGAAGVTATEQELMVVVQQHSEIKHVAKFKASAFNNLKIDKHSLETGVAQITLFAGEVPLAERLVFIDRADALKVHIKPNKANYAKRDSVTVELNVTDVNGKPVMGSFSVAVLDESKVKYNENIDNNIRSGLLLTSELKGMIESPGYYFNEANAERKDHLDLLLLTQGWRKFSWKEVLADKYPQLSFKPEKHLSISGQLFNLQNKPLTNAQAILMSSQKRMFMADTKTDDKGHFNFDEMSFPDSLLFTIQGRNEKGKTNVKTLFPAEAEIAHSGKIVNPVDRHALENYFMQSKLRNESLFVKFEKDLIRIKEVEIKGVRQPLVPYSANRNGPGKADYIYTAENLTNVHSLWDYLTTYGKGIYRVFLKPSPEDQPVPYLFSSRTIDASIKNAIQFWIDGVPVNQELTDQIPVSDIATIEIMVSGLYAAMYGIDGANGNVEITMKRGTGKKLSEINTPGLSLIKPKGYVVEKEFYSPKYSVAQKADSKFTDHRSTIYWNANVVTDAAGKAVFKYFNADGVGVYTMIVQGIDADGRQGYGINKYLVH